MIVKEKDLLKKFNRKYFEGINLISIDRVNNFDE